VRGSGGSGGFSGSGGTSVLGARYAPIAAQITIVSQTTRNKRSHGEIHIYPSLSKISLSIPLNGDSIFISLLGMSMGRRRPLTLWAGRDSG
jgi:hypothetical protein